MSNCDFEPSPRLSKRRALLATLVPTLLLAPAVLDAQEIETIQLRHRTADDVLPTLRAFLEPAGALTGHGYQLFLRASAANVRQLKQLLARLDRAPRQLVITVRQEREDERASRSVGADGSVTITTRRVTGNAAIEAADTRTAGTAEAAQTVRVLEGGRAFIAIGTAIPLTFRRWVVNQGGITEARGTVFYEAVTGFHARPQLAGEVVTIELVPEQASLSASGFERAQVSTTVRGRLGEWIAVGGADLREQSGASGVLLAGASTQTSQRGLWLKVDDAGGAPR